ncbi:hypothetical protein IFM89_001786 [Coptis chinensis]|uniref:Cytochrome P450 n=1 Tax=Coptis chinensis TaxID=261450 RepID=A0A835HFV7_9MAGN|nr:hypothetical protein IFM89_001786 [Coptis chinensis]
MIPDAMIRELSHQKDEFITPMLMLLIALCVILWCHWVIKKPKKANPPLPPGPWGLPLVGNLFSLESDLHPCLANLSKRYGPIMKIKLGTRVCIVINSASVAKEVFKDHDTIFSNHDISPVAYAGTWSGTDMVFSPYGEHWRMLRKICVRELLSNSQLEALYYHRRREVRNMVIQMYAKGCKSIDIGDYVLTLTFSVMTNILWGGTLEGEEMKHFSAKFPEACEKFTSLLKSPNVSDLFPLLTRFDMQGLVTKMKKVNLWFDENLDFVINRRFEMKHQVEMTDFLQRLMEFKECGDQKVPFTTTHIKALLMFMTDEFKRSEMHCLNLSTSSKFSVPKKCIGRAT